MSQYIAGLLLGLGLILPIGSQNIYVLKQSIHLGLPRSLLIGLAAASCDSLLIIIGALGASVALNAVPGLRPTLLIAGTVFLMFLGIRSLRAQLPKADDPASGKDSLVKSVGATISASLLNPHAIIDTVGVIGLAISATADGALPFGIGAISASLIWFILLAVGGSLLSSKLTPKVRQWIDRISGIILIIFALRLAWEALLLIW
jgi:L-lysine exporter family protein LysE/ArgO